MYRINFVGDDALPFGHDFLLVERPDGVLAFLRESAISPAVLEDAWAAYRAMLETPRSASSLLGLRRVGIG